MRTLLMISLTFCVTGLGFASSARATVEGNLWTNIAVQDPQSGTISIVPTMVYDNYGSMPLQVASLASFQPLFAFAHGALPVSEEYPLGQNEVLFQGQRMVNMNLLSQSGLIWEPDPNFFGTSPGVNELKGMLDVSQLVTDKVSKEDRFFAARTIKAALVALNKNLENIVQRHPAYNKGYRLYVTIEGLENLDQSDLPGERIYAQNKWPFSLGSPLAAAYAQEISADPYLALQEGKYDALGSAPTGDGGAASGCSLGGTAGGSWTIVLWLMAALAFGLAERRRTSTSPHQK